MLKSHSASSLVDLARTSAAQVPSCHLLAEVAELAETHGVVILRCLINSLMMTLPSCPILWRSGESAIPPS